MGVFGVQLVLTMVTASFLHKLAPYYSLGRWLLTSGIRCYLPPTDKLLRPYITAPASNSKITKKKVIKRDKILSSSTSTPKEILAAVNFDPDSLDSNLAVPKSSNLKLEDSPLTWEEVDVLHYSSELEFLINLTLAAVFVYVSTSAYYFIWPLGASVEYNLSVIWVIVVMVYALKLLLSLTRVYLSDELSHQRSLCIVFTSLLFVLSLGVLLIDETSLDFGLEKSHQDICNSITVLLRALMKGRGKKGDVCAIPMWAFKITLALLCSFMSMTLVFPGFRFAETHFGTIRHTQTLLFKTCLHANYIAPMCCLSLWIRPLTQDVIAERSTVNLLGLYAVSYDTFRVSILFLVCLLRLALFKTYLQGHLDSAKWTVENLRQEQGRITISSLRKKVGNVFLFYAAFGVQYIVPYVLLLCSTLLLGLATSSAGSTKKPANLDSDNILILSQFGISSLRGCVAFISWWLCLSNAVTSGFGVVLKEFL